jgi:hypothetical protein
MLKAQGVWWKRHQTTFISCIHTNFVWKQLGYSCEHLLEVSFGKLAAFDFMSHTSKHPAY